MNEKEKCKIKSYVSKCQKFFRLDNIDIETFFYNDSQGTQREDKYLLDFCSKINPMSKLALSMVYKDDLYACIYVNCNYESMSLENDCLEKIILHEFIHIIQDIYPDNEQFINAISRQFYEKCRQLS